MSASLRIPMCSLPFRSLSRTNSPITFPALKNLKPSPLPSRSYPALNQMTLPLHQQPRITNTRAYNTTQLDPFGGQGCKICGLAPLSCDACQAEKNNMALKEAFIIREVSVDFGGKR